MSEFEQGLISLKNNNPLNYISKTYVPPHKCIRFSHLSESYVITGRMGSEVAFVELRVVPAKQGFVSMNTHPGWAKL